MKGGNMGKRTTPNWDTEEDLIMKSYYNKIPKEELMQRLPIRSWEAIINRAGKLGLTYKNSGITWEKKEDELVEYMFHANYSDEEISNCLVRRTVSAVTSRRRHLDLLTKKVVGKFSREEDDYVIENYHTMTPTEVAIRLGRSKQSVVGRFKHLDIENKRSAREKFTDYQVRDKLKEVNLKWIAGEYTGGIDRNLICLTEDEYVTTTSINIISRERWSPSPFHKQNPYKDINFRKFLTKLNEDYESMEIYDESSKKIKILEKSTGYFLDTCLNDMRSGRIPQPFGKGNRYSSLNFQKLLDNYNTKLIALEEYTNSYEMIKCVYRDTGYVVYTKQGQILREISPRIFGECNPYSYYNAKLMLKDRADIQVLNGDNDDYNGRVILKCMDDSCNHEWDAPLGCVTNKGTSCPKCADNMKGWSMSDWIKRSKNSNMFDSYKLYKIKCWNENELFYKIGITYTKFSNRINHRTIPYKHEIVELIESNDGEYIWSLEKELHRKHRKQGLSYEPRIEFGGRSECFRELLKEENND